MPGFVLLVRDRGDGDPAMRLGITVTRKIGNAVVRNRMKRRFRALAREVLPEVGVAGADHVLIGRQGGIERDFSSLRAEFEKALRKITASSARPEPVEGLSFSASGRKKGRASTGSARAGVGESTQSGEQR
jgi:ribonuclease P protein component